MIAVSRRRAFTLVELIVVIVILAFLLIVLLPLIQIAREAARRANCNCHMKQLGVALHNYHDVHGMFPPASTATGGSTKGWSWLACLLPFCEQAALYKKLGVETSAAPPAGSPGLTTRIGSFECPSYQGPSGKVALAQYKAMGASHPASLAGTGNYPGSHPDGAMYPGVQHSIATISDGTSYTVIVAEAIDPNAAWCEGANATVVGLPDSVSYSNTHGHGTFYAPEGFNGEYDEDGGTEDLPTYLSKSVPAIGPGSYHPGVVNHLWADGSVNSVSKDVDAALYFFIITRAGGDPGSEFQAQESGR